MKNGILVLVAILAAAMFIAPAVEAAHPILHMGDSSGTMRVRGNTYQDELVDWCEDNYAGFTYAKACESPYYSINAKAMMNFALAYFLDPTDPACSLYGNKAITVGKALIDDPPRDYTCLADWMYRNNWYPARSALYAFACTYDWCFDKMTDAQAYAFRYSLVRTAQRWYSTAHISQASAVNDSCWGSNLPHNNYYYGELLGVLSAVLAVKQDTNAVDYVYTYLIDTMMVEAKKAKFASGAFISKMQSYSNSTGRDVGGISMESTSYGANDNEFYGMIIDILTRADTFTVSEWARDAFPRIIASQVYATYPGRTFSTATTSLSNMFGEGTMGNGELAGPQACAIWVASALTSNDDTAEAGRWWAKNIPEYSVTDNYGYRLCNWVLFDASIDATFPSVFTEPSRYCSGPQYLFVRGDTADFNDTRDGMLLTFRGGVANESHAHNGFGNITWYKGGYLIADPAVLVNDGNEIYTNDYYHNTVATDTCGTAYNAWRGNLNWSASTLEHSEALAAYIYYAFDFTPAYTGQPDYRGNTVLHREREFLYVPSDTLLFLFDRAKTYGHRIAVTAARAIDTLSAEYVYPFTWSLYTQGEFTTGNAAFEIDPTYGAYRLAGFVATPDTNLALTDITNDYPPESGVNTQVIRYRTVDPDSQTCFASALWVNTEATSDSLNRVVCSNGNAFGIVASMKTGGTTWVDRIALFSTDAEGDTGSVFTNDSVSVNYGRPADSAVIYLCNVAPSDTFYTKTLHRVDTMVVRVRRTYAAGWTVGYSTAAGVLTITSGSTGGTLPPDPPAPRPTVGGKDVIIFKED